MGGAALLSVCLTTAVTTGPNALGAALGATQAQLALAARCPWATGYGYPALFPPRPWRPRS